MMDAFSAYIPIDRRQAMARGEDLPDRTSGAALFADISGFTPLTEVLVNKLGPKLGAEELTQQLNLVYDALISQVHHYGGSVIGFSGDAITCWFDESFSTNLGQASLRATACGLVLQEVMERFKATEIPVAGPSPLSIKIAVVAGPVRRFRVGDPKIRYIDVLAGATLDRMAEAEHQAQSGEVVIGPEVVDQIGDKLALSEYRQDPGSDERFAVVTSLSVSVGATPWPVSSPSRQGRIKELTESQTQSWLLRPIHERLKSGQSQFLAELRPAVALFLRFEGLDYDQDEVAAEKLDGYIRWVQNTLAIFDGYLLQLTVGDKGSYLYAAFGAPVVRGDNAVRAVAAALDLRLPPPEFDFITEVQIGLSQGRMRVGAYGGSTRRTYGVLGDEVNIAARLMGLAKPGQILASPPIVKAASGRYHFKYLGKRKLKGKHNPLAISSVLRRRPPSQQRPSTIFTTSLVGREEELASIDQALQTVLAGEGRVLRLEGIAGVGKSHLAAEIVEQALKHDFRVAVGVCQSISRNVPHYPWQQVFRALLGLKDEPTEEKELTAWTTQQVAQIKAHFEDTNSDWLIRLPLLGDLLGLSIPDNETTAVFDAKLRRESLFALATEMIQNWASTQPLLLLLDDVHWMDESSQELTLALARAIADAQVLLFVVHRPRDGLVLPDLNRLSHHHRVNLHELSLPGVATLITNRLSGQISRLALQVIHSRAQGNPFFTEELLDTLREAQDLGQEADGTWTLCEFIMDTLQKANCLVKEDGEWVLAPYAPLDTLDLGIPGTIQGIVLSRIDRLPETHKLTLKVAGVIGRIFEVELLLRSHPNRLQKDAVLAHLQTMEGRDLIRLELPEPQLVYMFKHNITQEVTYDTLLQRQQQELHQSVAQALEGWQPEAVERLAYHYSHSRVRDKTLFYLDKAARKTQREYANETALNYYKQALTLEERWEWRQSQAEVLHTLGRREEEEASLRQLEANPAAPIFEAAYPWGQYYEAIANYPEAQAATERALATAQESGYMVNQARALAQLGLIARQPGDYERAKEYYQQALALFEGREEFSGEEIKALIYTANGLGTTYRQQGEFDQAKDSYQRALTLSRQYNNLSGEAEALNSLGVTAYYQRNLDEALTYLQQALSIRRTIGDRTGEGKSLYSLSFAYRDKGDYGQAQESLSAALAISQATGSRWDEVNIWNDMGILYQELGDLFAARTYLEQGLQLAQEIGDEEGRGYLLSNLGLVVRDQGELDTAEKLLTEGLTIMQTLNNDHQVSFFLSYLSTVNLQAGNLAQAQEQAQAALSLRQDLNLHLRTADDLAILAATILATGNTEEALSYAEQALAILEESGGEGPEFPQRDYFIGYQVFLAAVGQQDRAQAALQSAYNLVIGRADKIIDPTSRQSFLEKVAINSEIVAEAARVLGSDL